MEHFCRPWFPLVFEFGCKLAGDGRQPRNASIWTFVRTLSELYWKSDGRLLDWNNNKGTPIRLCLHPNSKSPQL